MADTVTHGQFRKFLQKYHFTPKGKRNNLYVGLLNGVPVVVAFHYHKDNDTIPTGTISAISRQLKLKKTELIDMIKSR